MNLLPREEKFFQDFQDQAQLATEAAEALHQAVLGGHKNLQGAADAIAEMEKKGDTKMHDIMVRLNKTFITPLDPEDIHSLAGHLEDVLDFIEEAAHNLAAHGVDPIPAPVGELTSLILQQTKSLAAAMKALAESKPVLEHCLEIHRLESVGDTVFRRVIAELFARETNAIELIKLKEVYENLEATTDRCEDVAVALQEVMVKNG
jgi:uncharacterized protein